MNIFEYNNLEYVMFEVIVFISEYIHMWIYSRAHLHISLIYNTIWIYSEYNIVFEYKICCRMHSYGIMVQTDVNIFIPYSIVSMLNTKWLYSEYIQVW